MAGEKICPYCQTRISETESYIVCSQCYIPHHEECWRENGACTTYGCNGYPLNPGACDASDLGRESIDLTQDGLNVQRCPYCGQQIKATAIKCKYCKRFIQESHTSALQWPQQAPTTELVLPPNYPPDFNPDSFSWGAFFLGPIWYLAHGMWLKALMMFLLNGVVGAATGGAAVVFGIGLACWYGKMFHKDHIRFYNTNQQFFW